MMTMTTVFVTNHRDMEEVGKETVKEVTMSTEPAPCLACNDLDGNILTFKIDE